MRRVIADQLYVGDLPIIRSKNRAKLLHKGDEVHIMGRPAVYLLDHEGARGYSERGRVESATLLHPLHRTATIERSSEGPRMEMSTVLR
jgi:hypothetical protein